MVDKQVVKKPTPKGVNVPTPSIPKVRPSADKLLFDFLKANNITLTLEPLSTKVCSIDDGSLIVNKPKVGAKFNV